MHYQILEIEAFACVFTLIQYPLQMFIILALQYKRQYKILLIICFNCVISPIKISFFPKDIIYVHSKHF